MVVYVLDLNFGKVTGSNHIILSSPNFKVYKSVALMSLMSGLKPSPWPAITGGSLRTLTPVDYIHCTSWPPGPKVCLVQLALQTQPHECEQLTAALATASASKCDHFYRSTYGICGNILCPQPSSHLPIKGSTTRPNRPKSRQAGLSLEQTHCLYNIL